MSGVFTLIGGVAAAGISAGTSASQGAASAKQARINAALLQKARDEGISEIHNATQLSNNYQQPYAKAGSTALTNYSQQLGNVSNLVAPPNPQDYLKKNGKVDTTKLAQASQAWKDQAKQWAQQNGVQAFAQGSNLDQATAWYAKTAQPVLAQAAQNRQANTAEGITQAANTAYKNSEQYYAPVTDLASFKNDVGYSPQVYDEQTWKDSNDPNYIAAPKAINSLEDLKANDPGYDFRLQQGINSVQQSAVSRGLLNSGGTLKAISDYGQEYASGEYQNAFQRYLSLLQQRQSAFSDAANRAQTAFQNAYSRGLQSQGQFNTQYMTGKNTENQQNQFLIGVGQEAANQKSNTANNAAVAAANLYSGSATAQVANNNIATASKNQASQNLSNALTNGITNATYAYLNRNGTADNSGNTLASNPMLTNTR